jgi:hypothetical protein
MAEYDIAKTKVVTLLVKIELSAMSERKIRFAILINIRYVVERTAAVKEKEDGALADVEKHADVALTTAKGGESYVLAKRKRHADAQGARVRASNNDERMQRIGRDGDKQTVNQKPWHGVRRRKHKHRGDVLLHVLLATANPDGFLIRPVLLRDGAAFALKADNLATKQTQGRIGNLLVGSGAPQRGGFLNQDSVSIRHANQFKYGGVAD